jgi:hypothetical protein
VPRSAAFLCSVLLLVLADAVAAQHGDGWNGTRWGMSPAEIDAALGEAVQRVEPPLRYAGASARRALPEVDVAGYAYRALLQFADEDGGLQQVLLQRDRRLDAPRAFAAALAAFTAAHGAPDLVCDSPRTGPDTSPIVRERVWREGATTVHLVFLDFTGDSMRYDPMQEIDPLVPDLERRLHARRSYPQRLLIRYHPSGRSDLMSQGCGG